MTIDTFRRNENNGLHVIMPLSGRMKLDCMLVNESVEFVHQQIREGASLEELTRRYEERAERLAAERDAAGEGGNGSPAAGAGPDGQGASTRPRVEPPPPTRGEERFDLYRILLMLQDHDLCEFGDEQLLSLLPEGRELRGSSQIMPTVALAKTSDFLKASLASGEVRPFYSMPSYERLDESYFDRGNMIRRHLTQEMVHFIQLDDKGAVQAASLLSGLLFQPQTLRISYVAARHPSPADFQEAVGSHMASVCGLLSVVTLSAAIRFEFTVGQETDVFLHDDFIEVIGELGFRRAYEIPDELGPNSGVVGYDKALY